MATQAGRIPFGTMHVDAAGKVIDHEDPARKSLVGSDLFKALGPRFEAELLRGRLRAFLASGEGLLRLEVMLDGGGGSSRPVSVSFGRICAETAIVRIRPI